MSHTCLCLLSRSWYSFTDPGGMEGWVDLGAKVAKAEIRTHNLPIANPALYYTATSAPERRPQKSLCVVVVVVVVVYYGHFLCYVSVCLCVFCLLTVLVKKLSVLAKAKKTLLMTPFCGKEIISTKPRLKSIYDFSVLNRCFIEHVYSPQWADIKRWKSKNVSVLSSALHNYFILVYGMIGL